MAKILCYYARHCSDCGKSLSGKRASNVTRCDKCQVKYRREYRRDWSRAFRKKKEGNDNGNAES